MFLVHYESLHGDKDYGHSTVEEPEENSVFWGLLRLLVKAGDEQMKRIIDAPGNVITLNPNIQNITKLPCKNSTAADY